MEFHRSLGSWKQTPFPNSAPCMCLSHVFLNTGTGEWARPTAVTYRPTKHECTDTPTGSGRMQASQHTADVGQTPLSTATKESIIKFKQIQIAKVS